MLCYQTLYGVNKETHCKKYSFYNFTYRTLNRLTWNIRLLHNHNVFLNFHSFKSQAVTQPENKTTGIPKGIDYFLHSLYRAIRKWWESNVLSELLIGGLGKGFSIFDAVASCIGLASEVVRMKMQYFFLLRMYITLYCLRYIMKKQIKLYPQLNQHPFIWIKIIMW